MITLLVGDFRGKQLQLLENSSNYIFITEDSAEYSWFSTSVVDQLPLYSLNNVNIVIMLGFNDCLYSCLWKTYNISAIINSYAKTINSLIEQYPDFAFYVCSVNPIDSDYPFTEYDSGVIPKADLDKKIKQFNNGIEEKCAATFLDCYSYLTNTGFTTRDGVRYTEDTCNFINGYILNQLKISQSSDFSDTFIPRSAPEDAPNPNDDSFLYWKTTSTGGYNKCMNVKSGCVIPNCTGYAWGRFMEILDSSPELDPDTETSDLSTYNAGKWFTFNDGYERGQLPRLGAVACWAGTTNDTKAGHVAIVEKINYVDGKLESIVTSESGWRGSGTAYNRTNSRYIPGRTDADNAVTNPHFYVTTRTNTTADSNWGPLGSDTYNGYKFQGFIYNPKVTDSGVKDFITKDQVISKNARLSDAEMETNARYIWNYFGSKGWSINAVAGMLGNIESESRANPGVWQSYKPWGNGYGLVQWTPYTNFTDWCEKYGYDMADMDSALKRLEAELASDGLEEGSDPELKHAWMTAAYDMSFREFTTSKLPAGYLGKVFMLNYERPGDKSIANQNLRAKQAEKWYEFLASYTPGTLTPLSIADLRVCNLSTIDAKISLLARSCTSCSYELFDSKGRQVEMRNLPVSGLTDSTEIIVFSCKNLKPNTSYKLTVNASGESDTDNAEASIEFTTVQALPESLNSVKIKALDTKLPYNEFQLNVTPEKPDFGYWKNKNGKDCGFVMQLIINGQVKKEKIVSTLEKNFNLNDYFDYTSKVGDIIQIGIRTWVKDDDDKKIFDDEFAKTSNTIIMLKKPVTAYLNID